MERAPGESARGKKKVRGEHERKKSKKYRRERDRTRLTTAASLPTGQTARRSILVQTKPFWCEVVNALCCVWGQEIPPLKGNCSNGES